jgi:hypothetical protein
MNTWVALGLDKLQVIWELYVLLDVETKTLMC